MTFLGNFKISVEQIIDCLDGSDLDLLDSDDDSDWEDNQIDLKQSEENLSNYSIDSYCKESDHEISMPKPKTGAKKQKGKKKVMEWSNKDEFDAGNTEWADEFTGFGHVENSPIMDILSKYFSNDLFESIANETNIYTLTMTGVSIKTNAFNLKFGNSLALTFRWGILVTLEYECIGKRLRELIRLQMQ